MVFSWHNSQPSSECTICFLQRPWRTQTLSINFLVDLSIWGKLMNQRHGEERLLFPGLLKGLWGSRLQSRAKMEPGDYLRVSIILVPSFYLAESWRIGCVKTKLTHITEAIQQSISSLRVFSYVPLIFLFLQCFWCAFNSKFWQRKGLTSAVPNAIFTWLSKNAAICPQAEIASSKEGQRLSLGTSTTAKHIFKIFILSRNFLQSNVNLAISYFHKPHLYLGYSKKKKSNNSIHIS